MFGKWSPAKVVHMFLFTGLILVLLGFFLSFLNILVSNQILSSSSLLGQGSFFLETLTRRQILIESFAQPLTFLGIGFLLYAIGYAHYMKKEGGMM